MNRDSDIEMESLLRRYARRGAKGLAGAKDASAKPDAVGATHMDADELSAYAEGALSDAARSRYASHLADCDSCRKIVTQLVISSGLAAEEQSKVAATVDVPARSWREWLAALFSPPVLRYAVPALALFAVITVALIVATRNRDENSFVAKNEPQQQSANTTARGQGDETATATTTTETTGANDNQGTTANANTSSATRNASAPTGEAGQKDVTPGATSVQLDGVEDKPAPKPADAPMNDRRELSEQERKAEATRTEQPVQTSPSTDTMARSKEKDDASLAAQQKQRESGYGVGGAGAAAAPPQAAGRRSRAAETAGTTAPGAATDSANEERQKNQALRGTPSTAGAGRSRRDAAGADEDSAETTRVVAGIRFRQRNGVWVDTNYNSSRSLSKVQRGSERYRALVADEPVIGTVANQLGNVIVVVKGRAYHIY